MKRMLTLTIVTEPIGILSYGDRVGNYTLLKKISTFSGEEFPFASDKMLSYELKRAGREYHNWKLLDEGIAKKIKELREMISKKKYKRKKEIEETEEAEMTIDTEKLTLDIIREYQEGDLFGFTFPIKGGGAINRNKAVVFDHIISVNPYTGSQNLIHNIDARERYLKYIGEDEKSRQAIVYFEEHRSPYIYTVSIELHRVGREDKSGKLAIDNHERASRVKQVLDILEKSFSRRVGGKVYPLTPLFVIGGLYEYCVPYFMNSLKVSYGGSMVSVKLLKGIIPRGLEYVCGVRALGELITLEKVENMVSLEDAFSKLRQDVEVCYAEQQ